MVPVVWSSPLNAQYSLCLPLLLRDCYKKKLQFIQCTLSLLHDQWQCIILISVQKGWKYLLIKDRTTCFKGKELLYQNKWMNPDNHDDKDNGGRWSLWWWQWWWWWWYQTTTCNTTVWKWNINRKYMLHGCIMISVPSVLAKDSWCVLQERYCGKPKSSS